MSNVRSYTDKQLLDRVKLLPSYASIPDDYWLLGVQSDEDKFNSFDDKFYLFKGDRFVLVASGTTNAGKSAMMGYEKYNKKGVAVIKTDEWYHRLWKTNSLHRGRMKALKQVMKILHFRDNNKNTKIEEIGEVYNAVIGCNFHTNSYNRFTKVVRWVIGGWSACCQVCNDPIKYYKILSLTSKQDFVTYCLLKEF